MNTPLGLRFILGLVVLLSLVTMAYAGGRDIVTLKDFPDRFLLTKPNTFPHNREASVATLRWCSGSSRNAVRFPFGLSVQLHRNPQVFRAAA